MAKKTVDRISRVMEFIDEQRAVDTDNEADIDFMNSIIERLETRIQTAEDELEEGEEEEMGEDDSEDMPEDEEEGV